MNTKVHVSHGTHIIGDLTGCNLDGIAAGEDELEHVRVIVSQAIQKYGLRELGSYYHFFETDGITAVVALSESHVSFHTWPENNYVSMDVFVCHYSGDQSDAAKGLFETLANWFQPADIKMQVLYR